MLTRAEYLIQVAEEVRGDEKWWFRYLSKEFEGDRCKITAGDLEQILASGKLDTKQEEMIKEACIPGSDMAKRLIKYKSPAETPMVDSLLEAFGTKRNKK